MGGGGGSGVGAGLAAGRRPGRPAGDGLAGRTGAERQRRPSGRRGGRRPLAGGRPDAPPPSSDG